MSLWQPSDYRSPEWQAARRGAAARSGGLCQFCGAVPGTEAHHWTYGVTPATVTADHAIWICTVCHNLATEFRRTVFYGGWDRFKLLAAFKAVVEQEFDPALIRRFETPPDAALAHRLPAPPAAQDAFEVPQSVAEKPVLPAPPKPRMDF